VVKLLIQHGADVNALFRCKETALHHAATGRHTFEAVRLLVEHGADPEARDAFDLTPLQLAAGRGNTGAVEVLIRLGANVNLRPTECSYNWDESGVRWPFLREYGCALPLYQAVCVSSAEIVNLLLDVLVKSADNRTPIEMLEGHRRSAELLRPLVVTAVLP
jgi:ankyrin repeat protein